MVSHLKQVGELGSGLGIRVLGDPSSDLGLQLGSIPCHGIDLHRLIAIV
jgi:hypothetical protein